jgi:2-polyprenyl-3-methyl-5-hydroxy-6-metoxy-1,4-benzoquinol methylase
MKEIKRCPICEGESLLHYMELKDYMVTKEYFSIVICGDCGFHFTNPVPDQETVGRYYQSEEYVSHSSSQKGLINSIYNSVRKTTLNKKRKWVDRFSPGKNVLDIGCGTGHFAAVMKKAKYNVTGLEPDPIARNNAKSLNDFQPLDISALYKLPDNSFDAITMWHVLEHVYDLNDAIKEYKRILKVGGVLFVAVPNLESYDAEYYKEFWAAYDVPRHLYHFRKTDIESLFGKIDLTLIDVLPMIFDSYYVSMLSEKYRKGSFLNAMSVGRKSNALGKKRGYSSQVYVLKKNK